MNETQETDFEHRFIIRGIDPFLESLHNTITSPEYENGLTSFSVLMIYQEKEFMKFVKQRSRLRSLTDTELRNYQLNLRAVRCFYCLIEIPF